MSYSPHGRFLFSFFCFLFSFSARAWVGLQRQQWAFLMGLVGLVPREVQGASLTGAELRLCFAGKVGGWRPEWSLPSRLSPHPFQELHVLYFMGLLWQMKNQNRSSFRYWASRQLHLPSGNQWMSTLMEVLVFFMVLITSKSRIRKSFCSGIIGDLDLGNLEKRCYQPF